jgi:putative PIG3 family NAD(P)H quinone oxidoreductase
MLAVVAPEPGGPEALQVISRPVPQPGPGEVLIKVAAAGVNGADLTQRKGRYPIPPGTPDILGLECAGEIVALGASVTEWRVGDKVCALLIGGGYAEYCAVPAPQCLPIPAGLSVIEAAALPEVAMTVWSNVFEIGRLAPGETILVHGGASGIGTHTIQLAHRLGAKVLATAGSDTKCRRCEELGALRAINYKTEDFVTVAREATGGAGVDVILDMVGGDYIQRGLDLLAPGGRLVMLAHKQGSKVQLDLAPIQAKNLYLTGSRLRPRPIPEKGRLAAAVGKAVWPLIEAGDVKPIIDSKFPLRAAAEAHRRMESGEHIGKVLLTT